MSQVVNLMERSSKPISNIKLVDHAITIQLKKIENYYEKHEQYTEENINEKAEAAMANLIELLKIRQNIKN